MVCEWAVEIWLWNPIIDMTNLKTLPIIDEEDPWITKLNGLIYELGDAQRSVDKGLYYTYRKQGKLYHHPGLSPEQMAEAVVRLNRAKTALDDMYE